MLYTSDYEPMLGMMYDIDNGALVCTFMSSHQFAHKIICSMASYMVGQWLLKMAAPITEGTSEVIGIAWAVVAGLCC